MNNPFEDTMNKECEDGFRALCGRIEEILRNPGEGDGEFCREMRSGKMLGVMIAEDSSGARHTLYAFSGQLGYSGFYYPGFVDPVFDYLQPDGYFKKCEKEISLLTDEIRIDEAGELAEANKIYEHEKSVSESRIGEYKEIIQRSKRERAEHRRRGVSDEEEQELIARSQFEKAELVRMKKRERERLEPFAQRLNKAQEYLERLKEKRRACSERLQRWLFDSFRVMNARGESRSLTEIFAGTPLKVPPSGSGECCGPKLLQAAYKRNLKPLAMTEYWYGNPKGRELRIHGKQYTACRGKCLPIMGWMLQGLEVSPALEYEGVDEGKVYSPELIYENEWFCIVEKPSGMLSVPGKGSVTSLQQWLIQRYGANRDVRMVHRLDQDTSGLMIAAFGSEAYKMLQSLFASRKVKKQYVAILEGDYQSGGLPTKGEITLPLLPDWLDRPRQLVDIENGKEAVTEYEFVEVKNERSRVIFYPHTGRTHQLRVHSASVSGLGMPIVGDRLYGRGVGRSGERLHLHASKLEFFFPPSGERYIFESQPPF